LTRGITEQRNGTFDQLPEDMSDQIHSLNIPQISNLGSDPMSLTPDLVDLKHTDTLLLLKSYETRNH
jgi:hypothetical protein